MMRMIKKSSIVTRQTKIESTDGTYIILIFSKFEVGPCPHFAFVKSG